MNAIDGTEHYERATEAPPPSLLAVVIDTNPYAWASLSPSLPLSKAIAEILIFINAHLAFNHTNQVAVLASHCQRVEWLYPRPSSSKTRAEVNGLATTNGKGKSNPSTLDANKYRPFRVIEDEVLHNLRELLASTTDAELESTNTTLLAGALTLALSHINKASISLASSASSGPTTFAGETPIDATPATQAQQLGSNTSLNSRVLVLSTSGDLAAQYIPLMNLVFAAQHQRVAVDILKLAGDTVLLQQASFTTNGVFLAPVQPEGEDEETDGAQMSLLPYLMQAFLPDAHARLHLLPATSSSVDFRAACFCHRKVVDIGFVCSVCLSIFCEALADGICLTCGTRLSLKEIETALGRPPGPKKKKKKRDGTSALPSGAATPSAGPSAGEGDRMDLDV